MTDLGTLTHTTCSGRAICFTNRAYIVDYSQSGEELDKVWSAEITLAHELKPKVDLLRNRFKKAILNKAASPD